MRTTQLQRLLDYFKLNESDFKDYHPTVLMAIGSFNTSPLTRTHIKLMAKLDFCYHDITFTVVVQRDDNQVHEAEFDYLSDAIDYFNKILDEENNYGTGY